MVLLSGLTNQSWSIPCPLFHGAFCNTEVFPQSNLQTRTSLGTYGSGYQNRWTKFSQDPVSLLSWFSWHADVIFQLGCRTGATLIPWWWSLFISLSFQSTLGLQACHHNPYPIRYDDHASASSQHGLQRVIVHNSGGGGGKMKRKRILFKFSLFFLMSTFVGLCFCFHSFKLLFSLLYLFIVFQSLWLLHYHSYCCYIWYYFNISVTGFDHIAVFVIKILCYNCMRSCHCCMCCCIWFFFTSCCISLL